MSFSKVNFKYIVGLNIIFPASSLIIFGLDNRFTTFMTPYLFFWAIFFMINIGLYLFRLFRRHGLEKIYILSNTFIVILPIFLYSLYPFTLSAFLILGLIIALGYIVPFISIKATWWLYTLGGKLPLPKKVAWLKEEVYPGEIRNASLQEMGDWTIRITIPILFLSLIIYRAHGNIVLFLLHLMSLIGVFGGSLAFGVKAKKAASFSKEH